MYYSHMNYFDYQNNVQLMMQLLVNLTFALNDPSKIWLHQGQYLSIYNTDEVEISPQLREGIS